MHVSISFFFLFVLDLQKVASTQVSNVVHFFETLKKDDQSKQKVYYQSGFGTFTAPLIVTPILTKLSKVRILSPELIYIRISFFRFSIKGLHGILKRTLSVSLGSYCLYFSYCFVRWLQISYGKLRGSYCHSVWNISANHGCEIYHR